jgi:hypothetical protein
MTIWGSVFIRGFSQNFEKRLLAPSCPPVCPSAWNNSAPIGRIFMKFGIWIFFKNLSRTLQVLLKPDNNTVTLHEYHCTYLNISRLIVVRMSNVSHKNFREKSKQKNCPIILIRKSYRLWDCVEKYGRGRQATAIRRMRFAGWVSKAINTQ